MSPQEVAAGLSAEERRVIGEVSDGHLWPLGAQPGCADQLYRKGLLTSNGEFVPIRLTSAGRAVAEALTEVKS